MCGRYALTTPPDVLAAIFRLADVPQQFQFRYNIAPTQQVPVVVQRPAGRELVQMRWGLIPCWAKDESIGNRLINARCETAADRKVFRQAFKSRRCIVPASGFFEWRKLSDNRKQPYYIRRADGEPLGLAGLCETWRDPDGQLVRSFTILTTAANQMVSKLHDRMPVILEPEDFDRWLDLNVDDAAQLSHVLAPAAEGVLECHAVSARVNSPKVDEPSLLDPVEPLPEQTAAKSRRSGDQTPSLFGESP